MLVIKLLPCPHCGGTDIQIDWNSVVEKHFVRCYNCHMQGPEIYGKNATAHAWNALPRPLVWTKETPKVSGWYLCRDVAEYIFIDLVQAIGNPSVYQGCQDLDWAGPIPEPREVKHD